MWASRNCTTVGTVQPKERNFINIRPDILLPFEFTMLWVSTHLLVNMHNTMRVMAKKCSAWTVWRRPLEQKSYSYGEDALWIGLHLHAWMETYHIHSECLWITKFLPHRCIWILSDLNGSPTLVYVCVLVAHQCILYTSIYICKLPCTKWPWRYEYTINTTSNMQRFNTAGSNHDKWLVSAEYYEQLDRHFTGMSSEHNVDWICVSQFSMCVSYNINVIQWSSYLIQSWCSVYS